MKKNIHQQIIISGVGGQGILFVTSLLAEAAIQKGFPVFTSETHGMAQRGGTVLSHLKVGDFSSPLIRPFQADGILALKPESLSCHGAYLKPGGYAVVNSPESQSVVMSQAGCPEKARIFSVDADRLARISGNPKSVNLVLLGFALAKLSDPDEQQESLFCSVRDIKAVLESRLTDKKEKTALFMKAVETGIDDAKEGIPE